MSAIHASSHPVSVPAQRTKDTWVYYPAPSGMLQRTCRLFDLFLRPRRLQYGGADEPSRTEPSWTGAHRYLPRTSGPCAPANPVESASPSSPRERYDSQCCYVRWCVVTARPNRPASWAVLTSGPEGKACSFVASGLEDAAEAAASGEPADQLLWVQAELC
jgi:hypothetical protein